MAYGRQVIREVRVEDPEALMRRYKASGDIELRNQLVMHYLQHVNVAIYSMRSILLSNVPFDDFFNQGILALIDCIERYDPERGASFDTYSYMGIRGSILKYLRKQNWLPNRVWEARKRISQVQKKLEQKLMREPSDAELAEALGISEKKLAQYIMEISAVDALSFEELMEQTLEGVRRKPAQPTEPEVDRGLLEEELRLALAGAIDSLPPKQKQIITLYYYENLNLREIGQVLNLSQQRISQIRMSALDRLRKTLEEFRDK
ncbi:MAG: FliA/WhiG family RNA polymerase sigma factor [Peptococcaceae bacterium]|nr:FliA/WhiG family RNA polymerase sigma factor [Peptococcaceae bacterium]